MKPIYIPSGKAKEYGDYAINIYTGCPHDQMPDVNGEYAYDCEWRRPIARAPQSWCYVEEYDGKR